MCIKNLHIIYLKYEQMKNEIPKANSYYELNKIKLIRLIFKFVTLILINFLKKKNGHNSCTGNV